MTQLNMHRLFAAMYFLLLPIVSLANESCALNTDLAGTLEQKRDSYSNSWTQLDSCLQPKGGYKKFLGRTLMTSDTVGDGLCKVKVPAACESHQRAFCDSVKDVVAVEKRSALESERAFFCNERAIAAKREEERRRQGQGTERSTCDGLNCTVK